MKGGMMPFIMTGMIDNNTVKIFTHFLSNEMIFRCVLEWKYKLNSVNVCLGYTKSPEKTNALQTRLGAPLVSEWYAPF